MNAAFLLLTTAMIAGADTPAANPAPAKPLAAPVYSVGTGGCAGCGGCTSCGGCDSCGCESEGFFAKLKARFHHSSDCDCGCESGCGGCESSGCFSKHFGHHNECGCDTGCAGCGSACDTCEHGGGLREKLRGLFHRHDDECGCECGGCTGCGYGGVMTTAPGTMKPEPIHQPKKDDELKKLPSDDKKNPEKPGSVRIIPQPVDVPNLDLTPTSGKSPF